MSAMQEEIDLYLDTCAIADTHARAGLTVHEAHYHGHDLVLVKAGVGKVNTAMCTQLLIDQFGVHTVICTGTAGALHDDLEVGDIVVAEDCVQHDLDVSFLGLPRGAVPFADLRFFEAAPALVERACDVDLPDHHVRTGRICTGDTFIQDSGARDAIRDELGGACVEMEGAAVGQVCTLNDTPFLLVRAVSDHADGRSDVDFQAFLEEAAHSSARIVLHLLKVLDPGNGTMEGR
ncbi:MAG: 5'-methylthioadenosine/adenosylhomocysteine nucleosidase [Bacteroidetes bacterium SW_9_63_38]|nr:MAG: 5'-methylthioadenosine/adenosylhomocysteine nucleosidase [Bacteroidetes bacterium SW_9_63_38]